eukprot:scaffold678099_cov78-Prasinocladus_malaysianus.AAC.1
MSNSGPISARDKKHLANVFEANASKNPLIQKFVPLIEREEGNCNNFVLPHTTVTAIVQNAQARDTRTTTVQESDMNNTENILAPTIAAFCSSFAYERFEKGVNRFVLGDVTKRSDNFVERSDDA